MKLKVLVLAAIAATTLVACGGGTAGKKQWQDVPDYAKAVYENENYTYPCFFTKAADNEDVFTAEGGLFYLGNNANHGGGTCFDRKGRGYYSYLVTFTASGDDDESDYLFRLIYAGNLYGVSMSDAWQYIFHFKVTEANPDAEPCFLKKSPVKRYADSWYCVKIEEIQKASKWFAELQKTEPQKSSFTAENSEKPLRSVKSEIGASVLWRGFIDGQSHDFRSLYLTCGMVINIPDGKININDKAERSDGPYDGYGKRVINFTGKTFDGLYDAENNAIEGSFTIE